MLPVVASRIFLYREECNSDEERRFIEQLDRRAKAGSWYADSWSHTTDHVLIAISLTRDGSVYRDLRADYVDGQLLLGDDETHQFVTSLDPTKPDVQLITGRPPEQLADIAADWFESELRSRFVY